MGSHSLLQGIFPTEGSDLGLLSLLEESPPPGGFFTAEPTREAPASQFTLIFIKCTGLALLGVC